MKKRIIPRLFFALLAALLLFTACSEDTNDTDSTTTVVKLDSVRFEFLTPSLVRLEYASSEHFLNKPTVVIQKRNWPNVKIQTSKEDGWLTAKTPKLTLRYKLHSGRFTAQNLKISWHDSLGSGQWHPGQKDSGNLGGIIHSYNKVPAHTNPKKEMEKTRGLLSRNGWALINDSRTPVWSKKKQWITPRKQKDNQDWYLFIYGHDYKKVLREYARLSGPVPMVPRYVLGPWITDMNFQYFPHSAKAQSGYYKNYGENHLKQEVLKFRHNNIPLDVLVMDYGWHKYGWQGGYDWSPLIPKPTQFLKWLHQHGVHVSVNDHPGYSNNASVLSDSDSHAKEVRKKLGIPLPPKPTFKKALSKSWKFKTDPDSVGVQQKWFATKFDDSGWQPIHAGNNWESQGHAGYNGYGWYRKTVTLPVSLPDSLFLVFGGVDDEYTVYINGHKAAHHGSRSNSVYNTLTYTNIRKFVRAGKPNLIAIRVYDWGGFGGLTKDPERLQNTRPAAKGIHFNLSNKKQARVFWNVLHKPLMKQGIDFWWIDGGTGAAKMSGLNEQLWTNRVYYVDSKKQTGRRAFIFSRYGGWGDQRYPGFFTGDADSRWPILASEVKLSVLGGNVLIPYATNDIGGFRGNKIAFNLYARWVEFGVFSPIFRFHSAHENPKDGNARMPWNYGKKGMKLVKKYLQLRSRLIPYIYTYTRIAHDKALPLLRPLYLRYPNLKQVYQHSHEYFFGKEMLIAPVIQPSTKRTIYLPPGRWIDFFSGKKYKGGQSITAQYKVDQIPVFVRAGSIIPEQPAMPYAGAHPLETVILNIYGSGDGNFNLYNDDGISLNFKRGQYARTKMKYSSGNGRHHIVIGPTKGSFQGQVKMRSYQLHIHSINKPQSISMNGKAFKNWKWHLRDSTVVIKLHKMSIRKKITVDWK